MAVTPGTAGAGTVTTEEDIFRDDSGTAGILVTCVTGSAVPLLVSVDGLHDLTEFATIRAGKSIEFLLGISGIRRVRAKGDGGTATVDWTVTQKLTRT